LLGPDRDLVVLAGLAARQQADDLGVGQVEEPDRVDMMLIIENTDQS
jgi:hypothetical protein